MFKNCWEKDSWLQSYEGYLLSTNGFSSSSSPSSWSEKQIAQLNSVVRSATDSQKRKNFSFFDTQSYIKSLTI